MSRNTMPVQKKWSARDYDNKTPTLRPHGFTEAKRSILQKTSLLLSKSEGVAPEVHQQ